MGNSEKEMIFFRLFKDQNKKPKVISTGIKASQGSVKCFYTRRYNDDNDDDNDDDNNDDDESNLLYIEEPPKIVIIRDRENAFEYDIAVYERIGKNWEHWEMMAIVEKSKNN